MATKRRHDDLDEPQQDSGRQMRNRTRQQTEAAVARLPRRIVNPSNRTGPRPTAAQLQKLMEPLQPTAPTDLPDALFFKLPREIRDKIYHEIWQTGPRIKQRFLHKFYPITYGDIDLFLYPETPTAHHAWLLASKQMLHEGIQQLHRHSVWHLDLTYDEVSNRQYIMPLLMPGNAHTLAIDLYDCERWCWSTRDAPVSRLKKAASRLIEKAARWAVPNSDVQTIQIKMGCWLFYYSPPNPSDLHQLKAHTNLKCLDVKAIIYPGPRLPSPSDPTHLVSQMESVGEEIFGNASVQFTSNVYYRNECFQVLCLEHRIRKEGSD